MNWSFTKGVANLIEIGQAVLWRKTTISTTTPMTLEEHRLKWHNSIASSAMGLYITSCLKLKKTH